MTEANPMPNADHIARADRMNLDIEISPLVIAGHGRVADYWTWRLVYRNERRPSMASNRFKSSGVLTSDLEETLTRMEADGYLA